MRIPTASSLLLCIGFIAPWTPAQGSEYLVREPAIGTDSAQFELEFPESLQPPQKSTLGVKAQSKGRDSFPRYVARRGEDFHLEFSLVPYPAGETLRRNPRAQLTLLAKSLVEGSDGKLTELRHQWISGFPMVDVRFSAQRRHLRVSIILYPGQMVFLQAISSHRSQLSAADVNAFFSGVHTTGLTPPATYELKTFRYDLNFLPGTQLDWDRGVLTLSHKAANWKVVIIEDTVPERANLQVLCDDLAESMAIGGPVLLHQAPRVLPKTKKGLELASVAFSPNTPGKTSSMHWIHRISDTRHTFAIAACLKLEKTAAGEYKSKTPVPSGIQTIVDSFNPSR